MSSRSLICLIAAALAAVAAVPSTAAAAIPARKAMVRELNRARNMHGIPSVSGNSSLRNAALRHSDDMILRDYFAHTSPSGSTIYHRIVRTGYVTGYAWTAGETLAWGTGPLASPRATVRAWLHSPEHRAILLSPTYRSVGVARACGRFMGYSGACVWTVDWVKRW